MNDAQQAEEFFIEASLAALRKLKDSPNDDEVPNAILDAIIETRFIFEKPHWLPWKLL